MVVCAVAGYAQEWERVSFLSPSRTMVDVKVLSNGRIIAVGLYGAIIQSDDRGESWTPVYSGVRNNLRRLEHVDSMHVWAVGEFGVILYSNDGGTSWERQYCIGQEHLRDIDFVDSLHGFIVGERGCYYHTSDGGATWPGYIDVDAPHQNDLLSTAFADSLHGVAVGGQSRSQSPRIRVTNDGSQTWTSINVPYLGWLADVEYLGNDRYIAVGRHHMILRSEDGGESWITDTTWYNDSLEAFRSVDFLDSLYGVAVSDSGLLIRTEDGGLNWDTIGFSIGGHQSLNVLSHDTLLTSAGRVRFSYDGGATWIQTATIPKGNILDAEFLTNDFGWLLLDENRLWRTSDGATWNEIQFELADTLTAIDFVNDTLGFGCADNSSIYRTSDGGLTWEARDAGTHYPVHAVQMANELRGWTVCDAGVIVGTNDGGETWQAESLDDGGFLTSIAVLDSLHAWAVGAGGTLRRTTDGTTWESLPQIAAEDFYGLFFFDTLTGFAVGGNGAVYKTTDGGESWLGQNIPWVTTLFAVGFANVLDGWVVGEWGVVFRTHDGGQTWQQVYVPDIYHLYDLYISPTRGWAVGVSGVVLRSDYILPAEEDVEPLTPASYALSVFPNPFNSTATVQFELPHAARVELSLFDILGRRAVTLSDQAYAAGAHTLALEADHLATGLYFMHLRSAEFSTTRKLLLVR